MARLNQNPYPPLDENTLKNPFFIVVDMINGFAKEGALADAAISECAPEIASLLSRFPENVLFIRDAHGKDAREFQSFPAHCLEGTEESEVIEELQPYAQNCVLKNSTNAFMAPDFQKWLPNLENAREIVITGCCTDICVLQLALALVTWLNQNDRKEMRVLVPADCVDTFDIPGSHDAAFWNETALQLMQAAGVEVYSHIGESL